MKAFQILSNSITLTLTLTLTLIPHTYGSCPCQTVADFSELSDIITSASSGDVIRLCPFSIEKDNSEFGIKIETENLHIQCAKESRDDVCEILGVGLSTSSGAYNYQVFNLVNVDDVTLQGFNIQFVHKGAVRVAGKNAQILDCVFLDSQSPPKETGAIVEVVMSSSSLTVVDSVFRNNMGGAIQNEGTLVVSHCTFEDNASTPVWISNDVTENRGGGTGGAIFNSIGGTMMLYDSSFIDNLADVNGPAVYSHEPTAFDLGSNCGHGNNVVENTQDEVMNVLGTCDGIYYRYEADGETDSNLCATFGTACTSR